MIEREESPLTNSLVLGLVSEYISFEDLKAFRTVNSTWLDASSTEWKKRARLKLDSKGQAARVVPNMLQYAASYPNIKIFRKAPNAFIERCQDSLTNLVLHRVAFENVTSLRKIIFYGLPCLKSLELDSLVVPLGTKEEKKLDAELAVVSKGLHKLSIIMPEKEGKNWQNIFMKWRFTEIVEVFSNVKDLSITDYRTFINASNANDLFRELSNARIKLTKLKLMLLRSVGDFEPIITYVQSFGDEIIQFEASTHRLFTKCFRNLSVERLTCLKFPMTDWTWIYTCDGMRGQFENLVELQIGGLGLGSLDFLSRMPKLTKLALDCIRILKPESAARADNVKVLELCSSKTTNFDAVLAKFPNVKSLTLTHSDNSPDLHSLLARVAVFYPDLEELCVKERPLYSDEIGVLVRVKKIFKRKTGHLTNLSNCDVDVNLFEPITRLINLRSFQQIIAGDRKQDLVFGDESARNVFLKLPNLKRLKLCNVSMSAEVIEELKEKILVTDIS